MTKPQEGHEDALGTSRTVPPPTKPVGPKSEIVYHWISQAIADGVLLPKDRVNADQISRDLAVSKIPVREAIAQLVTEGTLVVLPNIGATVTPLSWRELSNIQQARLILEPPLVRVVARSFTAEGIGRLTQNCEELHEWARTGTGDPFTLNRDFHLALASMAGNELIASMVDLMLRRVGRYRVVAIHSPESAVCNSDEHTEIIEAIRVHDSELAEQLMSTHLRSRHSIASDARDVDQRYFSDSPMESMFIA